MSSSHDLTTPEGRQELGSRVNRWRGNRRIGFWVRVVTTVLAVMLAGAGAVLLLGSLSWLRPDYVADRHVPGTDGSISIAHSGSYVLVRHQAELPENCTVTATDGYELLLEPWRYNSHPDGLQFHAEPGRYDVKCDGGQDGVAAVSRDGYEQALRGPLRVDSPAWPMLIGALVFYYGGRLAAERLNPENKRPLYPA